MPRGKFQKKIKRLTPKKPVLKRKKNKAKTARPSKKTVTKNAKKTVRVFKTVVSSVSSLPAAPLVANLPKEISDSASPKNPIAPSAKISDEKFFIAPTTPFIPAKFLVPPKITASFSKNPSIQLLARPASGHLVDLKSAFAQKEKPAKENRPKNFAAGERTLCSHRRTKFSFEHSWPVAFIKFTAALCLEIAIGAGKLAVFPVAAILNLAERIDFDRRRDLVEAATTTTAPPEAAAPEAETEPELPVFPKFPERRSFRFERAILSFAGMSLAVLMPLEGMNIYRSLSAVKEKAESAGSQGIAVIAAAENGVLPDPDAIESARAAFSEAGAAVRQVGLIGNTFIDWLPIVGEKYRSGKGLVAAGDALLSAAASLHDFTDALSSSEDVMGKIQKLDQAAQATEPSLATAVSSLLQVKNVPPQFTEEDFKQNLSLLISAQSALKSFLDVLPSVYNILGRDSAKRYLVIFQNNAELRPTGGFMGSFALIDVDRGRITKIEVPAGGPYDLQGSLKANVLAPDPLKLISARWQFQDANWFPDFPTSAQKIIWFYGKAGGPTVDGVVAINAPVLAKLVDAVGPINMPDYNEVVVGDNVLRATQEIVESDAARASGKPKQFIADLLPKVLDKILTGDRAATLRAVSIFSDSLTNKDIQLYMRDPEVENKLSSLGWTGELASLPPETDSFELIRANIAGQKTDNAIETMIDHRSSIADDGTITDTVKITLTHRGKKGEAMTGVRNVEYLRAYVPPGSVLLASGGDIRPPDYKLFDAPPPGAVPDQLLAEITGSIVHDQTTGVAVNNEFDRTVFGAWTQTDPGASSTVAFTYTLPWKAMPTKISASLSAKILMTSTPDGSYEHNMVFSNQSGAGSTAVSTSLSLPLSWYTEFASPEGIAAANGYQTNFILTGERHFTLKAATPAANNK